MKGVDIVQIRGFRPEDYKAAQSLLESVQAYHAEQRPDIYSPAHHFDPCAYYGERLHQPELLSAVAEEDGAIAGICLVSLEEHQAGHALLTPRRFAAVEILCVAPEFRRRGVAEALMEDVKTKAKALGLSGLDLSVAAFNTPAQALYKKLGFTTRSEKMEWKIEQEKEIAP